MTGGRGAGHPAGGSAPLLILAPHADDEALGAGALIRAGCRSGRATLVALLTDGAASHPGRDGLAAVRRAELADGLSILAEGAGPPAAVLALSAPDGGLDARAIDLSASAPLARWLMDHPDATVLAPDPDDGHPDHRAAFGLAARLVGDGLAARLVSMPISQRLDAVAAGAGDPPAGRFHVVPIEPADAAIKARAIAAHRSQCVDTGDGFHLTPAMIAPFLAEERFVLVHDRGDGDDGAVEPAHFDALFAASPDPWRYDAAPEEAERRDATLTAAGLDDGPPPTVLELGCANGAMTAALAPRCARLVAVDASAVALGHARARLATLGQAGARVTLVEGAAPGVLDRLPDAPRQGFDRVLLSDMLYYLGLPGVIATVRAAARLTAPGGRMVIAAYRGDTQCRLTGAMAAEAAIAQLSGWHRHPRVTTMLAHIDVLERP